MDVTQLAAELEEIQDKIVEIKDLVEDLVYLWENDSFYPDAENILADLKEALEIVED